MSQLTVQIFSPDLIETFEHYKKAFNAAQISLARGSKNEPIHLVMDILGNHIAIAPLAPHEITKGNVTVICLGFQNKESLLKAHDVLTEGGHSEGLKELPWSPLQGYVTDKYGVVWCIGL
jgi:uncharacterized glyoxalase superfamily protein PhnB